MTMHASAPPYVSLLDRARAFGRALREAGHSTGISYNEIADTVTALALIAEHGESLLDDFDQGGYDAIEPVLTPDRPEGYVKPVQPTDPKDAEINRLRAELDSLRVDPRDAELENLRAQLDQRKDERSSWGAIPGPDPDPETPDETAARIQADSEAARNRATETAETAGTHVTVESDSPPTTVESPADKKDRK